ncbi:MAG: ABC transporter substrate binding protein [Bacillota bacterium]|jgi:ABC-type uncharacterized transport system substrate-binding protein
MGILILIVIIRPKTALSRHEPAVKNDFSTKKWRIGYCESEPFPNYADTLYALLKGLNELGWVTKVDACGYRPGQQDTAGMWRWLASRQLSPRLEFVGDAYFSLASLSEKDYAQITARLQKTKVDLMLVMGTLAGKLFAADRRRIPAMIFSASNAVQSGISKTATDSGKENVWAHMDPQRFRRQIAVFYDTFKFHRLGLVYENSPTAYSYSAIDHVEMMARQKGFAISRIYVAEPKNLGDQRRYYADLAQAYRQLSRRVDAMYLTVASIDKRWLPHLLTPFYAGKVPVFSQLGADEVKYGALMSVSSVDFKNLGRFGAQNMVRFFDGASLRSLPQVFESTPKLIINLETAVKTGCRFPFEMLLSADQVFVKIGAAKN